MNERITIPNNMLIVLQDDVLLYENSHLTNKQTRFLIMTYALRHNLSEKALKDLLQLFNCILPQKVFPSLYRFTKHFEKHSSSEVKKHFYCPSCEAYLQFENTINIVECVYCNVVNNKKDLQKAGKYFLTTSIGNKIQQLMRDPNIINAIEKYNIEDISSVISSTIYQQLKQTGVIGPNSISIQWNTDGAQVFHSSKISMWPIQVGINEFPYSLRKDNLILAGLWVGEGSPRMDIFLRPFVDELIKLHREGVQCDIPNIGQQIIKVHCLIASVDSVARPKVTYFATHNKYFTPKNIDRLIHTEAICFLMYIDRKYDTIQWQVGMFVLFERRN